jgi:hypothetical protein
MSKRIRIDHIRQAFAPARTMRAGKPTYRLFLNDEVTK